MTKKQIVIKALTAFEIDTDNVTFAGYVNGKVRVMVDGEYFGIYDFGRNTFVD